MSSLFRNKLVLFVGWVGAFLAGTWVLVYGFPWLEFQILQWVLLHQPAHYIEIR